MALNLLGVSWGRLQWLVIPVRIAYGSDVGLAMELMRNVTREHPKVLEDPAK